jgi:hypothetical protein
MNAQLTELCAQYRSNAARVQTIVSKAGEARLATRPRPDSWSAAECIAHLTLSTERFLPVWRSAIASARANGFVENGAFKMDLVGSFLHWVLQPPARLRVKAPAHLQPAAVTEVLSGFLLSQAQLFNVVSESIGLALDRIQIASPVAARVRYSVWSSFRATDAHQRRHLWQAERALGLSE